ncbi:MULTISPECIES: ATP-binding protein [Halorussus]|uniref:ATP-binding protein n=1 Tax=Halorussus TaxID=1070314 RepID=UPI00209FFD5F|nr:ATP-binding protein [Halorussus vallis]USZ77013.1 ATP-binding protein [Halorussus vallis]
MTDLGDFSRSGGTDEDDSATAESDAPETAARDADATETSAGDAATDASETDTSATASSETDTSATTDDDAASEFGPSTDIGDFGAGGSATDASDSGATDDRFEEMATSPVGSDRGIGTLTASEGLRISEDGEETHLQAYVTADNREDVRVGKYLLVPYPDGEKLFCRITALEYQREFHSDDATEIHSRRAMRRDSIEEADYKFMATLDPVAVLYDDDGELKRRMTDRVPKPEAVVREAADKDEIKTGLKMPGDGVFLGHLSVGGEKVKTAARPPTIDYRLKDDYRDGDPLVFRHTLVAGGTGSGKTHGAKNILRQFLGEERRYDMEDDAERRAAVVQFDPQDEYAQMHDDNPDVTPDDERRWEREGVACGGHDDTVAFVPKVGRSSYAADHHRAEQVEFTIPFSMVRRRPWLVAGASLNDNQYNALRLLLDRFFNTHGESGTYGDFVDFVDDPALREELDESGHVHEATYDAVKRRAISATFNDVFDQDARPITDQVKKFVRPGGLTVVPTYHVNDSRATEVVVLALASLLVDEKLSNDPRYGRIKETPLVVGMDEAHNFLTDAENVQARKVITKFTEAAKQGRKERLGLFLITQDPQDIADSVFKQVNTTVVLNLGDEDAIKSVNIPAELEGKVPYMEKGQMVVYSPDNSEPVEIIGLPKCVTKHGRE